MAKGFDVILKDNSKEILEELESKKDVILEEWGLTAERFAKLGCTVKEGSDRKAGAFACVYQNCVIHLW